MNPSFDTSIDPVVAGDILGRLVLSPLGILGVLCLGFGIQVALRVLMGADRKPARPSKPSTWTRF